MPTITVHPSGYSSADSSYSSISSSYPVSNGYTDTSSTSYAYITCQTGSRAESYISYTFDFSEIPQNAIIQSVTAKAKGRVSSTSYLSSAYYEIFKGGDAVTGQVSYRGTSATVYTIGDCGAWTRAELDDLMIRATAVRGTSNTSRAAYIYFYGAEITVEYAVGTPRTVSASLTGEGTISPSGQSTHYDGETFELTITPADKSAQVTVSNNGADVTSQLVAHGSEAEAALTAADVSLSGIQSGSSYAEYCIGHTAENPTSSGTSSNMYASSGSTGHADYSFDVSGIPSGAVIEGISAAVYGHRESSTISSTYVSRCSLVCGGSAISDTVDFPSTSNSRIEVTAESLPSRAELDSLVLRHEVGYYGGLVLGITLTVSYSTGSGLDHYTYTCTVSGDMVIAVVIGGAADVILFRSGGAWAAAAKVWKKVGGSWVEQSDLKNVFEAGVKYVRG